MISYTNDPLVLESGDHLELLTHMCAYGLGAMVEAATNTPPVLRWTPGMRPRAELHHGELDPLGVASVIHEHAVRLAESSAWPNERLPLAGTKTNLYVAAMSPRISRVRSEQWPMLEERRHRVLDHVSQEGSWLELLLLWSFGEPCYWRASRNKKGDLDQDSAASRLELQPRNRGSEIVTTRLAPLATALANRTPEQILAGLTGASGPSDTVGKNAPDSRSAIGFRGPGPVDDAVSWCALCGISQFAINHTLKESVTAGTVQLGGSGRSEWFFVPAWRGSWTPARLRTVLASRQLRVAARGRLGAVGQVPVVSPEIAVAEQWLGSRGVGAVLGFPVERHGSDNAPERRAQRGRLYPIGRSR